MIVNKQLKQAIYEREKQLSLGTESISLKHLKPRVLLRTNLLLCYRVQKILFV